MQRFHHNARSLLASAALIAAAAIGVTSNATAAPAFTTLHNFCSIGNCDDGLFPMARLVRDGDGNYFGTTQSGAFDTSNGTIFELVRSGTKYKFRTLYTFCKTDETCPKGPRAELIIGTDGSLYGTTEIGGPNLGGTVFKLTPNATHRKWKLSILYGFCVQSGCPDGQSVGTGLTYQGALSGVPYDGVSPLFGMTHFGGSHDQGVVYELTFSGKKKPKQTVLYNFCSEDNCSDGKNSYDSLIVDGNGNLFGASPYGGGFDPDGGVVFEMSPAGGGAYTYTVLHHFCSLADCKDGKQPGGPLILDTEGNLIGTSGTGGKSNGGTIFKIVPNGTKSKLTTLYNFCSKANCADGNGPGGVVMDANGSLFGAAAFGSVNSPGVAGVIFELQGTTESVLYNFCSQPNCTDGPQPSAGLTLGSEGDLFGVTRIGGAGNGGTAFEFKP